METYLFPLRASRARVKRANALQRERLNGPEFSLTFSGVPAKFRNALDREALIDQVGGFRAAALKETGWYQMALKQDEEITRVKILETIDRLFYRQGIRAVGVDTIVAELGISKKTLYRYFRSKSEMIEAYLRGRFRPFPENSDKPPVEQILSNFAWLERSLSSKKEYRGCAYLNALAELGEDERESRDLAAHYKESRRLWFRDLLSKLDVDDPETLATQLSLLIDGAYSAMLTRKDASSTRAAIAAARVLLKNAGVNLVYATPRGSANDSAANRETPQNARRRQRN